MYPGENITFTPGNASPFSFVTTPFTSISATAVFVPVGIATAGLELTTMASVNKLMLIILRFAIRGRFFGVVICSLISLILVGYNICTAEFSKPASFKIPDIEN